MKRFLPFVLVLTAMLVPASRAHAGLVLISTDSLITESCFTIDDNNTAGLRNVYITHVMGPGTTGIRFKLEAQPGVTWTYVSEEHYAPVLVGNTQSGITFCYGTCETQYKVLAKVTYMTYGTSGECADIRVVPVPGSNTIDELLCDGTDSNADGGVFFVQAPNGCSEPQCPHTYYGPPAVPYDFCGAVGTEPSTWGAVKSRYR